MYGAETVLRTDFPPKPVVVKISIFSFFTISDQMSLEVKRQNIPYRPALEAVPRQEAAAIKGGKGFLCQWGRMIARIGMATTGKGVHCSTQSDFFFLFVDDQ